LNILGTPPLHLSLSVFGTCSGKAAAAKATAQQKRWQQQHSFAGIFCRVQRKFIHFHLNLQLCETVVEWVLTWLLPSWDWIAGEWYWVFRGISAFPSVYHGLFIFPAFAIGSGISNLAV